jgi:predicted nucleic acid-binding Zn ribbon protein
MARKTNKKEGIVFPEQNCVVCGKKFKGLFACSEKCCEKLMKIIFVVIAAGAIIEALRKAGVRFDD